MSAFNQAARDRARWSSERSSAESPAKADIDVAPIGLGCYASANRMAASGASVHSKARKSCSKFLWKECSNPAPQSRESLPDRRMVWRLKKGFSNKAGEA